MIEVIKHSSGFTVRGHAQYAEHGKDIVCAAVSALTQTLLQSIDDLCTDDINCVKMPGLIDVFHKELSEGAQLLMASFFVGIQMIADTYPNNVKLTKH